MYFINGLCLFNGIDAILVLVDWFTKMAYFARCAKTISAKATTNLFLKNVVRLHGVSNDVTSDHGSQFVSSFW